MKSPAERQADAAERVAKSVERDAARARRDSRRVKSYAGQTAREAIGALADDLCAFAGVSGSDQLADRMLAVWTEHYYERVE